MKKQMTDRIRVAVLEDDRISRESFAMIINREADMHCISAHESAEDALAKIPSDVPDVLVADINLPGKSGIECVSVLKQQFPQLQVMMITTYEDSESIYDSLRSGASGYILKRSAAVELIDAIREIHQGGSPMSMHIARKVVNFFQTEQAVQRNKSSMDKLTEREYEILSHLAKGLQYKEIAAVLNISVSTVRAHLHTVYSKLHVTSGTEAVLRYLNKDG